MNDTNTTAANHFYRLVSDFSKRTQGWQTAIFYETKPDERWDLTLVSQRVYGNRYEFLTVMAAAGVDRADMPLEQKRIILPTASQLALLKKQAGFESNPEYRANYAPTWIDE